MKFERSLDAEAVTFEVLSEDYSKLVFLRDDRFVEFHAQYGLHHRTRIPKFGRAMAYNAEACDLYLCGVGNEIYRLNTDQGRFLKPMTMDLGTDTAHCLGVNLQHGLVAAGTSRGVVECFDPRSQQRAGVLDVARGCLGWGGGGGGGGGLPQVTALAFTGDALTLACGTSTGQVLLYDIRANAATVVVDHHYDLPIKRVVPHALSGCILSADERVVKVWHQRTGDAFTTIENAAAIHDVAVCPNSGLIFMANEAEKMATYFVPALAPAPKWCSFLDSITEELEEEALTRVYDNYQFVTRQDLDSLNLAHLVGSKFLRAYMHGFFMDARLYAEAKAVAEPFAYEKYRKERIEKILEDGTARRFELKKAARDLPKVNRMLAKKMLLTQEKDRETRRRKGEDVAEPVDAAAAGASNPLGDSRFAAMFADPNFEVDTTSHEYRLLHPVEKQQYRGDMLDGAFTNLDGEGDEDESEPEGRATGAGANSDDDEYDARADRRATQQAKHAALQAKRVERRQQQQQQQTAGGAGRMRELRPGESFKPGTSLAGLAAARGSKLPFAKRLEREASTAAEFVKSRSRGGEMVVTFKAPAAAANKTKYTGDADAGGDADRRVTHERRGIKALRLAKPKQEFWRGAPVNPRT